MNRLALFDCDGTLVDGAHSILSAMEESFALHGLAAPPAHKVRAIVGLSLVEAMQVLAPEVDPIALADSYKEVFQALRRRGQVEEPLFPGIVALLDALEADGWLLGVATGKSDRGLGICLACHGLSSRFFTLQTADRHPSKPHPSMIEQAMADAGASPETTMMIGDTSYDMAMAAAAGAKAIGVLWGYHGEAELLAAGAHHIVAHPLDIITLAKVGS